ncbi:MAG: hypothetical protein KJ548_13155 [Actinobacteria bacterium]|nr:hypothetical protein [Actinomycetota bacterium]MCG2798674.1 hypothetical protein [Cellulomonas sp.]
MANSATLLADLLERWHVPPNQTPEMHRGGPPDLPGYWDDHKRAMRWLLEIDAALGAMEAIGEEVSHYRETQVAWFKGVFSLGSPWGSTVSSLRPTAAPLEIRMLRALAQQLDSVRYAPVIGSDELDRLSQALDESLRLVRTTPGLTDDVRRYLAGLIVEALACLNDVANGGEVTLRDAIYRVGGAMSVAVEEAVPEEHRQGWRDNVLRLLISFAVQATAGITTGVAVAEILPPN